MINNHKKINVLIFEPYPMGFGGNFITQRQIVEMIDRELFTPIIVSPVPGVAHDEFIKLDIECVIIPPNGKLTRYGGAILSANILDRLKVAVDLFHYNIQLARFIKERQIDIVYTNCVRAEMSIGLAARLTKVPSFLYIKGELANPVLDRLSFMLANKICFQCEQNRDDKYKKLVLLYKNKIDIIKPGISPDDILSIGKRDNAALIKELNIDPEYINIVVPAQLYPLKGQHIALEALSRLVNEFPKIRLYLLGDHVIDEYRSYKLELQQIIKKNELENNVVFTGWRRDALDIVALMDIVIHPSFSEGFPKAVIEAMALGKPVIATSVGGVRDAIKDGINGFSVLPGDIDTLEQRWRNLLINPGLRILLGKTAKETIFSNYIIKDKIAKLSKIWTDMARR